MMNRRSFLQSTLAFSLLGAEGLTYAQTAPPLETRQQMSPSHPMIMVFLRGGADGLAILSPLDDPHFIAARPPEMRFTATLDSVPAPIWYEQTLFYWHPAASPLADLYEAKRLAIFPAVGFVSETRSHFEAQEIMERGVQGLQQLPDRLGWFARQVPKSAIADHAGEPIALLPFFAGSARLPRAFAGASQVLVARDLQWGLGYPGGGNTLQALKALCAADQSAQSRSMHAHLTRFEQVQEAFPKKDQRVLPYVSAGNAPYPNTDPSVGLRSVARMVEAKLGLQFAWVDQGGWDTHESQPGRIQNLIGQLAMALKAFDEDMQARMQPYTLLVMTEFGRRLRSNRSNGTDHGHASLAMVMGTGVAGGKMMGGWPGLASAQLSQGVDLAVRTNYQTVFAYAKQWQQKI